MSRAPRPRDSETPTVALALGSGGARGLAHIPMLEALDELGLRPSLLAGTSMGAIVGAAYCAGMPAKDLRAHALAKFRDRAQAMARLIEARVGRFADMFSGFGNPFLVDPARVLAAFWPGGVPARFEDLEIPLVAVATDYHARTEAAFHTGELAPAIAASMAIPGLLRPVRHAGKVLVDGGAVNPLPFDHLIGRADIVVAIDVAGGTSADAARLPTGYEVTLGTIQIMQEAIVGAKLKIYRPQIVVRPQVQRFRALDFFETKALFTAAESAKQELKRELDRHIEAAAKS